MIRRLTSSVLVGRTAAVEQLRAAIVSVRSGDPRHVLVGGEAGVGKTRLLSRVRELAEAHGVRVLVGGCVRVGGAGLPFAPYTEILHSLVAQDGAAQATAIAGRASVDLARLVPSLSPERGPPVQEMWAQTRLFEALLFLFERLAARTPLLVQLEDLHWADAGTLAATSFLTRAIHAQPIGIVATYRTNGASGGPRLRPWLAEVTRAGIMERLDLEPLEQPELAELVRNISGEEIAPSTLARLHERSDGNPFFVEELLASGADTSSPMPISLRELLLARVDMVDAPKRRLLEIAAIGGRAVDHDVLVTVSGEAEERASDSLRGLVEYGLLTMLPMPDRDVYQFRHALLQEAVHDAIPVAEHRRLHRAYAEEIERCAPEAAGDASLLVELAHHWREARDPRALEASIRAGDAAMASFSFDIALNVFEQALLRWDPVASDIDHIGLLERAARAAYLSSHYERAVALCREAIDELGTVDAARRCELQVLLARVLWLSDWGAAVPTYQQALESAPSEPARVRIRAQAGLAQAYMLQGQYEQARPLCEEVVERAREIGARDLEGHGLNTLGVALAGVGDVEPAIEAIEASIATAVELDIPDDIGRAYVNRADILCYAGYPERACHSPEGLEAVSRSGMDSSYGVYLRYGLVDYAFRAGDWRRAARLLSEADRIIPDIEGTRLYRAVYVLDYLACIGSEEAPALWSWARRKLADRPPYSHASYAYLGGVELAAVAARPEEAVDAAWEGLDIVDRQDCWLDAAELARTAAWPVADMGIRARVAGDDEGVRTATERMDRLTEVVRESRPRLGEPKGRLGDLLDLDDAQVTEERRRMEASHDAASWHRIATGWSNVHQPYRALLARWREAEAAEGSGDRAPAISLLREAYGGATRLGAEPLASRMETLARKMRIRLGATSVESEDSAPAAYGLTPREREVLSRVAAGRTNRRIAEELGISESTAGVHVSHILSKLGVASRAEAVRVALSQDLVELEGSG